MTESSEPYVPPMTDNDLSAIRSRYLGVDKKKRKIRKMNDRKFVFDWDEQDDTFSSEAPAAVGGARQGAQVMFGRGHIAGMDDGGGAGPALHSAGKGAAGDGIQLADSLERRKAAKTGIDERHWTEKALDEMKERDWRIFREDFSISARGAYVHVGVVIRSQLRIPHRWTNPSSSALMERVRHTRRDSECRRHRWLQRAVPDSTSSNPDRSTEP